MRGNGKTVLLTTIAKKLEDTRMWVVVNLNPSTDFLEGLANELQYKLSKEEHISEVNISSAGVGLGVKDGNTSSKDYVNVIRSALKKIKKENKKVLVTIDEVVSNENTKRFASQFQVFIREDYPLYVIMAGLYDNIHNVQNSKELTFLLRTPKMILKPLSISRIVSAYRNIFSIETEQAKELAKETRGYALAFQILGLLYWRYGLSNKELVTEKYIEMLDEYAYSKIWERMSDIERKIAISISEGKKKISNVVRDAGLNEASIQKYRKRMLDKGIIISPEYGYIELALPRFGEIIRIYAD